MASTASSKFAPFDRHDEVYTMISETPLIASILKPRIQIRESALHPVLIFWHGGAFVVGSRLFEPWWPDWYVEVCI